MKIAILYGPRDLRIEEKFIDTDNLEDDQIWVETLLTAFKTGTDRGNYEGAESVPGAPNFPRWVGDSNLGVVRGVGRSVKKFKVGDRIVSRYPHQSEYVARQSECLVLVPNEVKSEDAVFSHLYALSALCFHKARFVPGETVAVLGLGVIGMGAVAVGRQYGAKVIALGNSEIRLEMALSVGAHTSLMSDDENIKQKIKETTGSCGIDLVVLTANPWQAYGKAVDIIRTDGRVAIVALPGRGEVPLDFNPLDMRWFYSKGISLISVNGRVGNMFPANEDLYSGESLCKQMLGYMAQGSLSPSSLISHRMIYSDMGHAYEMAYRREKNMLNVIFDWN